MRTQSAAISPPAQGGQSFVSSQPTGGQTSGSTKVAERSTAESPKSQTETHIAEQRVSEDHRAKAVAEKPVKPPSRLSNYQAEAAKLLSGAMTGRRKRRGEPEVPVADPVAEDQAGQASRPAKKGKKD
jgi:hypothetical protein